MAATRLIEQEHGVYVGTAHAHNGYYAGDFGRRDRVTPTTPNPHPVSPVPARRFVERPFSR